MNIDILLTGVTGFVGRFVLLDILEKYPNMKLGVIIRPLKNKTPIERFNSEIIHDTMFSKYMSLLSNVYVISTSIEEIEKTSLYIKSVNTIIHCAANVKHYDHYDVLYQDNVKNIKVIVELAYKLKSKQLILLSTCYVHLRVNKNEDTTINKDTVGSISRIPNAPRDHFYNDYCYTKWMGEEEVFKAASYIGNTMRIDIMRLSCVGSPIRKDLQSHPFSAQAHLGIISLINRGYINTIALNNTSRLSIIPVDIVSKYVVSKVEMFYTNNTNNQDDKTIVNKDNIINEKHDDIIKIHQVCAPKLLESYHPNLHTIILIANKEFNKQINLVTHDGSSPHYLPKWYSALRYINKDINKYVELHEKIQEFVLLFTSDDIRFDSSLPLDYFPDISEYKLLMDTYSYCIRNAHQMQYKKGVPLEGKDKFWHDISNKEHIQVCLKLKDSICSDSDSIESLKTKIWTLFCSTRKFTTKIIDGKWVYEPGLLDSYFSVTNISVCDDGSKIESIIIRNGLNKINKNIWHCEIIVQPELKEITHLLFQLDHGITDGLGMMKPLVNKFNYYIADKEIRSVNIPKHNAISVKDELVYIIMFILLVGLFYIYSYFSPNKYKGEYVKTPDISSCTVPLVKYKDRTFTANLLYNLTNTLYRHTRENTILYCIPTYISDGNQSDTKQICNNFVPMLIPVDCKSTIEDISNKLKLLKSILIRLMMSKFVELITYMGWDGIRKMLVSKINCIVSSVNMGNNMGSEIISSTHVATTTPEPILYCVTAVSTDKETHITVRSHDALVNAESILRGLC